MKITPNKSSIFALIIGIFSQLSVQAASPGSIVGFELFELSSSKKVSLESLKGKVVYVDFWASWCGPCKQSLPEFNKMYKKYKDQGFEIVAINLDSNPKDGQKFLNEFPVDYTVLYDGKGTVAEKFNVQAMPSSVLVDKKGVLRLNHKGFKVSDIKRLNTAIELLLAES